MAYYSNFEGAFEFADEDTLQRGLRAFADQAGDGSIAREDLRVEGLAIRINVDDSAPASCWLATIDALTALARSATHGQVDAYFEAGDDHDERIRVHAGGRVEDRGP